MTPFGLLTAALFTSALFAQTPNIAGVWKADIQKSKFPGPPGPQNPARLPSNYLVVITQHGEKLDEKTVVYRGNNEERSHLEFVTDGKSLVTYFHGVPTLVTASWIGNRLTLTEEVAGRNPSATKETDELSADGQTLTIDSATSFDGHQEQMRLTLNKQPESAGDPLRKPEETAGAKFKNVKTSLKNLPTSEFIDTMHYFTFSMGQKCEFCHVAHHFDSDDKKPKHAARAMIEMVNTANTQTFKDKQEVRSRIRFSSS
ncbi:MAG TPA: photosynthetic reaction center cytochrome c subunit family protein [Bryobacteraceae bacterium]|jgi:hypothetical protein|nr:photosynthetic reaction center cytochrome c subunit family protein [Bryobacteraceae bacterium]